MRNNWMFYFLPVFGISNFINCSKVENFLADLAVSRFTDCALFFFRQGGKLELDTAEVIRPVGVASYYNTFFSGETSQSANSTVLFPIENKFSVSIAHYNRRASVCKLAILCIENQKPPVLGRIKRFLSPVYHPLVRPDSDAWVWITSDPALLEPLLLSPELPARTKFKIGISATPSGELVIKSVCLFCSPGGEPRVINMPLRNPAYFDYFPDYVRNLNGKLLRISVPAAKSLVEIDSSLPGNAVNNGKRGSWISLLDEYLILKLNFTYNVFISSGKDGGRGGGTGLQLPDGKWIGTVGDILSDRADIGFCTGMTPKRLPVVSFTNSFFHVSWLSFTTTYGTRVFSPAALLWPFDLLMWTCIGASTLTVFLVFKLITLSMHLLRLDLGDAMSFARRGIVSKDEWGIEHQIFFTVTTYLDQDCVMPRSTPLRCFVALWLFFTLIITTIYRSKMVSLLAFPVLDKVPTTFEELTYSKYHVIFLKHGDAAYNTLKASTDPIYVKLVKEMEIMTGVGLDCLTRVMDKNSNTKESCIAYDFATNYIKARNLSDSDIRSLVVAPDTTYSVFMGFAVAGGSIYKKSLEEWMSWTIPCHLTDIWIKRDMYLNVRLPKRAWWVETNQTQKLSHSDGIESDDLTLKHISGAFYALIVCLLLCTGIFAQELIYFHWEKVTARAALLKGVKFILIGGFQRTQF